MKHHNFSISNPFKNNILDLNESHARPPVSKVGSGGSREIWAIGGGKGGVGKSLISANLGLSLARSGKRVIIIDMDLGGANLHTCLGVNTKTTLSDFITGRVASLESVISKTEFHNLSIISGAQDHIAITNLKTAQKNQLFAKLRELDADILLLDLGAGTSYTTMDCFLIADIQILAVVPEPTSIENTYRFIKTAFYRRLKSISLSPQVSDLVDMSMDEKNTLGIRTPVQLVNEICLIDPLQGDQLMLEMQKLCPYLIMNMVRSQADIEIGFSIKSVSKKFFGLNLNYLGFLEFDNNVWKAVRKRRPLIVEYPGTKLTVSFAKMAKILSDQMKARGNSKQIEMVNEV